MRQLSTQQKNPNTLNQKYENKIEKKESDELKTKGKFETLASHCMAKLDGVSV